MEFRKKYDIKKLSKASINEVLVYRAKNFLKKDVFFNKAQGGTKVKVISKYFRSVLKCGDKCLQDLMIVNEINLVSNNSGWKGLT